MSYPTEQELVARPLVQISEEEFHEFLNVLPPLAWVRPDAFERKFHKMIETFLLCEFQTGGVTAQFAECDGKHYFKYVVACDRSTWITRTMIEPMDNIEMGTAYDKSAA